MSSLRSKAGDRSILGDAASIDNSRPSRSRRNSFCVSNRPTDHEETPSKNDRRALLEKWRKERDASASGSGGGSLLPPSSENDNKKRTRFHDTPPLPPSSASSASNVFVAADRISTSTRERIRQRKHQKRLHQGESESPSAASPFTSGKSTIEFFDDEDERPNSRGISGRSPLLRKSLGSARRRSLSLNSARRGRASPALNQESDGKNHSPRRLYNQESDRIYLQTFRFFVKRYPS